MLANLRSNSLWSVTHLFSKYLGVDRAIFFGILTRAWGLLAGPVSLVLIASRFSLELQGYYYTFSSLLAITIFFEMGLGMVIQQFASHEWSSLKLDSNGRVAGEENALSRLAGLTKTSLQWYSVAGLASAICIGLIGYVFFSQQPNNEIQWQAPWLALSILSGANLVLVPIWSLLDGCNQVSTTYAARFVSGVIASLSAWAAIWLGAGLWTAVFVSLAAIIVALLFFGLKYSHFILSLTSIRGQSQINWIKEVWPMQWRIGLSWMSGYFIFFILTPAVFYFQGAAAAGQIGMTWTLVNVILAIGVTWIGTKSPAFGMLIAKQEYVALDRLFNRTLIQEMTISILVGLTLWLAILGLNIMEYSLALRFLPPLSSAALMLAIIVYLPVNAMATYLHAHKQEPYLGMTLLTGVLVALSTFLFAKFVGAGGVALGYLVCMLLVIIPHYRIFLRCRSQWHKLVIA